MANRKFFWFFCKICGQMSKGNRHQQICDKCFEMGEREVE